MNEDSSKSSIKSKRSNFSRLSDKLQAQNHPQIVETTCLEFENSKRNTSRSYSIGKGKIQEQNQVRKEKRHQKPQKDI